MRTLGSTPDAQAERHDLLKLNGNYQETRAAIITALFGFGDLERASMLQVTLPKHPGIKLKETKLVSLARKYFSIPDKFRNYYPVVTKQLKELLEEKKSSVLGAKRKRANPNMPLSKKRSVGRPKKRRPPLRSVGNTPSTLTFFSKIGNE